MKALRTLASLLAAAAMSACAIAADDPAAAKVAVTAPSAGQQLYGRHCLSCHQAGGGGVRNMQPPIKGGTWAVGDPRALALFVMTGGFDSGSRKDSDVGNVMPPFRQLTDDDLAAILSYIREKFGNGASAVTAAQIAEARSSLP